MNVFVVVIRMVMTVAVVVSVIVLYNLGVSFVRNGKFDFRSTTYHEQRIKRVRSKRAPHLQR